MGGRSQIQLHLMKGLAYPSLVFMWHIHVSPQMCSIKLSKTVLASYQFPRGICQAPEFPRRRNTLALTKSTEAEPVLKAGSDNEAFPGLFGEVK